ncbi:hypothetical protein DERP_013096 [Dermatophagoides pteronyssinus]|uniref:Uncharacterized protein n=1 Tax=Dermatophagoides pteronyssinus TaxID=6956 RepID=A0ABQ8J5S7_DERPT|nr:hypothetical protein DERP_013096 [Dermatophagoides pteronyssinus]
MIIPKHYYRFVIDRWVKNFQENNMMVVFVTFAAIDLEAIMNIVYEHRLKSIGNDYQAPGLSETKMIH